METKRAALWLLVVLAGCVPARTAAPGASPQELLSEGPPAVARHCTVLRHPAALPPADALVDSAALADALIRDAAGRSRGYAILSLGFDQNGFNVRRALVEHDLGAVLADTLQKLVFAHRREVEPGDAWGVRLRIDLGGAAPAMRVGRQLWCDARPLRATDVLGTTDPMDAWSVTRRAPAPTTGASGVILELHVDEIGRVRDMRVVGGYMTTRQEHQVLALVSDLHFAPATADGVPVATWTRMHMRMPSQ